MNSGVAFLWLTSISGTAYFIFMPIFCYVGPCSYVVLVTFFESWKCFPLKDGNMQQNSHNMYNELLCIKRSGNPKQI